MFTHEAILDDWKRHAQAHDDANFQFLRGLKARDHDEVDALGARLHAEAFRIIDCTRCANCCKTMAVELTGDDIARIATHLALTQEAFTTRYLKRGETGGQWEMARRPCPFLNTDNRCTIYDVRPACCAGYPHTDQPGFTGRTYSHSAGTLTCPAVFWVVEQMRRPSGRAHDGTPPVPERMKR